MPKKIPARRAATFLLGLALGGFVPAVSAAAVDTPPEAPSVRPATLPQGVYVWQRQRDARVDDAVAWAVRQPALSGGLWPLAAETALRGGAPHTVHVATPQTPRPRRAVWRIGPYAGDLDDDTVAPHLEETRARLCARGALSASTATGKNVDAPADPDTSGWDEIQIDFDCATARLPGYARWLRALRTRVAPASLTITALPTWLDAPAFADVARAVDAYVLQVHSLVRPASPDAPVSLCDPALAERAVAKASRLGVPFRVALPTYGYQVAFRPDGRFLGLVAEGPEPSWPPGTRLRRLAADPVELPALVRRWTAHPPPGCRGIVWFRLPVDGDRRNWTRTAFAAVLAGEAPLPRIEVTATPSSDPRLWDIRLRNDGTGEAAWPPRVALCPERTAGLRVRAADGVGGYHWEGGAFVAGASLAGEALRPGASQVIGWLRTDGDVAPAFDIEDFPHAP